MSKPKHLSLIVLAAMTVLALLLAGCSSGNSTPAQQVNQQGRQTVQDVNKSLVPPKVTDFTEYKNYIAAQKIYDDPSTIIWCTTTWGNASAPLVTVPIAGKLTSSS